jgi:hypothetical protein
MTAQPAPIPAAAPVESPEDEDVATTAVKFPEAGEESVIEGEED